MNYSDSVVYRPKIVCLCGSTKFEKEYREMEKLFELHGYIVLSIGFFTPISNPDDKRFVDRLHCEKIKLADEIFVIDKDTYIGDSTKTEIDLARALSKPIKYYSKEVQLDANRKERI